jgi:DNA replication licensing factor MCM3
LPCRNKKRFNYADRIVSCVDDHIQRNKLLSEDPTSNNKQNTRGMSDCPRVRIRVGDIRSYQSVLASSLVAFPLQHLRALEIAAHDIAQDFRPGYDSKLQNNTLVKIRVALVGPLLISPSSPRDLVSNLLGQLVCVEGVATKVSPSKPKLVKSVHYCEATKRHLDRTYVDATDPTLGLHEIDKEGRELLDRYIKITTAVYPTKDQDNNPLSTEFGFSEYKDYQTITLQEMPERAPMGQLPRSVDLILERDLVDKIKAGDRVQVVGVYRAITPGSSVQTTSAVFRTIILVNHLQILGHATSNLSFTKEDVSEIKALSKRSDILSILGRSVAPSIHGHDIIKKSLTLQLLSGVERNLANGTHLRGDINILMVGDPSTAKSQLLRAAMQLAPLAISTSGKGSSGVGLTAAVTSDPDTRERRLEAGAMVLADRGLVCIDEFDKMSEADRVSIHEVMEQQTVTIAKAGIHATLNARCSVLAAANPVYGQYDRRRRPQENIGLPDSLLSRFDLLFVVLDQLDPSVDRRIASHVLRGHRYRRPGMGLGPELPNAILYNCDSDEDSDSDDYALDITSRRPKASNVWQRAHFHPLTNTVSINDELDEQEVEDVLSQEFLRKYLHFAKNRIEPVLTDDAREAIASRYAEMRSRQDERTLPITARSLETIIRLASAHAKARLSHTVEADPDVTVAMDILGFALYHEQTESSISQSMKRDREDNDDDIAIIPSSQRIRTVEEDDVAENHSVTNSDPIGQYKSKIWESLSNNDGQIEISQLLLDDKEVLERALAALEKEQRIYRSGLTLFQI